MMRFSNRLDRNNKTTRYFTKTLPSDVFENIQKKFDTFCIRKVLEYLN